MTSPSEEDAGVVDAGWLAAAEGVEETAFAGAEEEDKPGFSSGLAASLAVSSAPDSVEDREGEFDTIALGGATSTVPRGIAGAVPVPKGMVKPIDASSRDAKDE